MGIPLDAGSPKPNKRTPRSPAASRTAASRTAASRQAFFVLNYRTRLAPPDASARALAMAARHCI
jgi:hypothetical protein